MTCPPRMFVIYKGERSALVELCRRKGMPIGAVRARLRDGWTIEEAIDTPVRAKRNLADAQVSPKVARRKVSEAGLGGDAAAEPDVDAQLERAVRRETAPPWERHPQPSVISPAPAAIPSRSELRALLVEAEAVLLASTAVELRRRRVLEQLREWQGRL